MRRKTWQEISGWSYAASAYLNDIPTERVEKFLSIWLHICFQYTGGSGRFFLQADMRGRF